MPPASLIYIRTSRELSTWVAQLARTAVLAVDTEGNSFHRYRDRVCLVQITVDGIDTIVDPLTVDDMSPLAPVMADPTRLKIFHDAVYDLAGMRRDFGYRFDGLFDTMIASRLLGETQFGLGAILARRFAFAADKKHQRSDWGRRPLTPAQLDYARHDTHFLAPLAALLRGELEGMGRWAWAQEDFARLTAVPPAAPERAREDGFWRLAGVRQLDPVTRGRLRALWQARERLAEALDRPPFKVLGEPVILGLAKAAPARLPELAAHPGVPASTARRFGPTLMAALAEATPVANDPPAGSQKRRRNGRLLDPRGRRRYEALREVRRQCGEALGLEPEVAMSNALLEDLARDPPSSLPLLRRRGELRGWRGELFGPQIWRDQAAQEGAEGADG